MIMVLRSTILVCPGPASVIVNQYWDTNGATAGIGGTGSWSTVSLTWNLQENGTVPTQAFDPIGRLIFGGTAGTVTIDTAGVTANGPLRFDTSGYTIAATGAGKLTLGGSTIEISDGRHQYEHHAPISGSNGLIKTGPGSLQLSGANDFTGAITINNGALVFDQEHPAWESQQRNCLSGGVLAPSASIALAATRNSSGNGTIRVQIGQTLTFNGNVALGNVTLASSDASHATAGEINLSGSSNSVGAIVLDDPVAITAPNGVTLTGDVTMPNITGPTRISWAGRPWRGTVAFGSSP
jgi:fibronectin-binding autotransporter adhesin